MKVRIPTEKLSTQEDQTHPHEDDINNNQMERLNDTIRPRNPIPENKMINSSRLMDFKHSIILPKNMDL